MIDAVREAGIFELMVPREYGGHGLDMDAFVETVLPLGEADASLAWVTSFYIEHNWMLCLFPEAFQRELYASRSHILAPGMVSPSGRAEPVDGGFRLNGRWSWATGAMHGEWAIAGAVVPRDPPELDVRFFAMPIDQVKIEDVWFVDGMCATGSNDVVIDDLFVPDDHSCSIVAACQGKAPGAHVHAGPLYRTPMFPLLACAAALPAVGQARGLVERFRERVAERVTMTGGRQATQSASQIRLAEVETQAHAAELLLRDGVRDLCALRDSATPTDRLRIRARIARAVHLSRSVADAVAQASGASAHFLDHPIQRAVRDLNTLSCHVVFNLDATNELYGRALLGKEPENPLV